MSIVLGLRNPGLGESGGYEGRGDPKNSCRDFTLVVQNLLGLINIEQD